MPTIDAVVKNVAGEVVKVRCGNVNREILEVWLAIRAQTEVFDVRPPAGGTNDAVHAVVDASGSARLQVMATNNPGLTLEALPAAPIELVVFGDSIAWGLGLKPEHKISARVASKIGDANPGATVKVLNFANSGARIGRDGESRSSYAVVLDGAGDPVRENILGESMDTRVTVHEQINAFLAQARDPAQVDYIVLCAGGNDVELSRIFTMLNRTGEIFSRVNEVIGDGSTSSEPLFELLQRMLTVFANARIFVLGYYRILSIRSSRFGAAAFALTLYYLTRSRPSPGTVFSGRAKTNMLANCAAFADGTEMAIRSTVDNISLPLIGSGPFVRHQRAFAAIPDFAPRHALFAPKGTTAVFRIGPSGYTTDETRPRRRAACALNFDGADRTLCNASSVGHPSVRGAGIYYDAIVPFL